MSIASRKFEGGGIGFRWKHILYIYERKTKNFKQLEGGETQRKIFRKRNIIKKVGSREYYKKG